MKTNSKILMSALFLATVAGSSLVVAQSTTSTTAAPSTATSTAPAGTGRGARGGPRGGQPRMELALLSLQEARHALDTAVADKGGNREKAIKSVDQAIEDVKAGIEYARQHPEEFGGRGGRGRGAGAAGTSAAPAGSGATS